MSHRLVVRGLVGLVVVWGGLAVGNTARAGLIVNLDFSKGDNLSTIAAQGLTFLASPNVQESQFAQVVDGKLILNTMGFPSDIYAGYQLAPAYAADRDTTLEVVTRVTNSTSAFGLYLGFGGEEEYAVLFANPNSWHMYQIASGSVSGEVKYTLSTSANSNSYVLKIDDVVVNTGTLPGGAANNAALYFGDGTPTGGNMRAEITSIRYSSVIPGGDAVAVPEPSNLVMALTGTLCMSVGYLHRIRSRRQARRSLAS
ncbi:hypothetical protein [Tautonia marina]|uniref:hypothetical protein n=1 Tax=Tautonia marina TaxID=2653855 RepID=UPI0012609F97|nr:hypothetical protein [Tautonia marina]